MKSKPAVREIIELNENWVFIDSDMGEKKIFTSSGAKGKKVTLPHANKILPFHNFDEKDYQFVSWYRNSFRLPAGTKGKRVFVEFDGVMLAARVFLNGKPVGEHKGGFTGFRFDLTKHIKFTGDNILAVEVDSRELAGIPPFGGQVDYLTFGGIYREARLIITEEIFLSDIFPLGLNVLQESRAMLIQYDIQNSGPARDIQIQAELLDDSGKVLAALSKPEKIGPKKTLFANICLQNLSAVRLWDIEDPYLYTIRLAILEDGTPVDQVEKTFGFREAHFAKDGKFYLNGRHVKLMGLNRHQNYPYLGPAVGRRMQYRDAEILKNELGLNIVRTSHYPQSPHFLDRCDQLGLLVLEEIPGWQHIGNEKWKEISCKELSEMIIRDRHHPSIVLWGVRINESPDDHAFYEKTNKLAHELDPTRQTGGIRCFRDSEFLEDVFTFNDFSGKVVDPNHVPYLITEFAGHMFPTKSYDLGQRQMEHALFHARVQNMQMGNPQIAGAVGWCAFDYNTHIDFGSGDRVCYHGVCDIFRLPKPAAAFYKSQIDPRKEVVLELGHPWARGDWNECMKSFVVFSNCDQIEVTVGDKETQTFYPDRDRFGHLPHPPFFIDKFIDRWGWAWEDLSIVGKIKGKVMVKKKYAADKLPVELVAWTDHPEIAADGRDMTQLSFQMVDKFGSVCPHAIGVVTTEATGGIELIGENPFPLVGGKGALYLRAGKKRGLVDITARASSGHQSKVKLKLV